MRRNLGLPVLLLVGAACSVLNSPEELKPTNEGGGTKAGSTSAGAANGGSTGGGGKEAQGGTPEAPGGASNNGGCADDCLPGGAPPVGKSCADSAEDCGSTAPICDDASGECRACATNDECDAAVGKPYCLDSGAAEGLCANCRTDADCDGTKPVCGAAGECRACNADNECASGACNMNGACADPTEVVYALAQTGVSSDACGSQDEPCRNLSDAVAKMTETRRTLVLVKTPKAFDGGGATFPAVKGLRVVGNGVAVKPLGDGAFAVPAGAAVQLDDVLVSGVTAADTAAVTCSGGALSVTRSTFQDNLVAILARDCELSVTQSSFLRNGTPTAYGSGALRISNCAANCTKKAVVLRSRFVENSVALYAWDQGQVTVENNVFWRNGADGYTRVIELRSLAARFAYNTLVENFNGCTYVGIVACDENCQNVANISFNNFPGQDCLDQVWYGGKLSYNLTEVAYPGATNKLGDPRFVDAENGDFTPQPGSPAIDAGSPSDAPPLDFFGTKRPVGAAPDIGAIEAK